MKLKPSAPPLGGSSYSRRASSYFNSKAFLDHDLNALPAYREQLLTVAAMTTLAPFVAEATREAAQ